MATDYLILSLLTGTLGFILWYALSPSLRLPKSFQIQYDVNSSYFSRILRRRLLGAFLFGGVPLLMVFWFKWLGDISLVDLGISFAWSPAVGYWLLGLLPVTLLFNFLSTRGRAHLLEYPEIRLTCWTPLMCICSAFFWLLYLVGMEFLFRGMVLQSVFMNTGSTWLALLVSTGMYGMIHYFKNNRISVGSIPYGLIMAYATLESGSLLPTIIVHVVGAWTTEWTALYLHPEVRVQRQLYD
ncbi:CPBP family intramembrane metalloprotease [Neolewinella lacunae]|uniref:CPBP family intramembrane metalloprotease n=1 Tax=Neolewinella lacunae TaxID=1517758 RepID=A0A923PQ34_9BACT|nr:CPBP family intramembrane glutamic endopeptidase [Neolewinella lacunae]MBC6996786.1 CPBP family intramembrane metalloprotease [Neolewinella lacunae]MDN3637014.1 CPBP family intramembrane metalloprotease [Neolewinella lacunae]